MARRRRSLASSTARGYGQAHRAARLVVLTRDGYVCQWCGARATDADHLGAKTPHPDGMVAACSSCNGARGAAKARLLSRHPPPSRTW